MKVLLIFFLLVSANAFGQDTLCAGSDEQAQFPGGLTALNHWLLENLQYPQDAMELALQGKCYVRFVIGTDGVCRDFKLIRGVTDCRSCDEEALRLCKLMPKWNPAMKCGKPVEVSVSLPITFKLN